MEKVKECMCRIRKYFVNEWQTRGSIIDLFYPLPVHSLSSPLSFTLPSSTSSPEKETILTRFNYPSVWHRGDLRSWIWFFLCPTCVECSCSLACGSVYLSVYANFAVFSPLPFTFGFARTELSKDHPYKSTNNTYCRREWQWNYESHFSRVFRSRRWTRWLRSVSWFLFTFIPYLARKFRCSLVTDGFREIRAQRKIRKHFSRKNQVK